MVGIGRSQAAHKPPMVLVIEDEVQSQQLLRVNLELLGYRVVTISDAPDGAELVEQYTPDLIVLDLMLPGTDGFDLCRQIRARSSVPIIIVSAYRQAPDKIRRLGLGSDDYVAKPFDPAEVAARVEAVLGHFQGLPPSAPPIFHSGVLQIDFSQRQVRMAGREVKLTSTEYRLLACLAQNVGRTMVADALLAKVWGSDYVGEYGSLHVCISRLRRKLGGTGRQHRLILTKIGVGYQMVAAEGHTPDAYHEWERGAPGEG